MAAHPAGRRARGHRRAVGDLRAAAKRRFNHHRRGTRAELYRRQQPALRCAPVGARAMRAGGRGAAAPAAGAWLPGGCGRGLLAGSAGQDPRHGRGLSALPEHQCPGGTAGRGAAE